MNLKLSSRHEYNTISNLINIRWIKIKLKLREPKSNGKKVNIGRHKCGATFEKSDRTTSNKSSKVRFSFISALNRLNTDFKNRGKRSLLLGECNQLNARFCCEQTYHRNNCSAKIFFVVFGIDFISWILNEIVVTYLKLYDY